MQILGVHSNGLEQMLACFRLAGLEPGEESAGRVLVVLVLIHQVLEVVAKNTALGTEEEKGGLSETHCHRSGKFKMYGQ